MNFMQPRNATLVDLLDKVLDKGLIINADIIISLANVPLIGVKLNAAIAAIETMLDYGMMNDLEAVKIKEKTALAEKVLV